MIFYVQGFGLRKKLGRHLAKDAWTVPLLEMGALFGRVPPIQKSREHVPYPFVSFCVQYSKTT